MAKQNSSQMREELDAWVKTLRNKPHEFSKDKPSEDSLERLYKLCRNRNVIIRLSKLIEETNPTAKAKELLLAICRRSVPILALADTPPSIRKRQLKQIAKASKLLAFRIQENTISGVIPAGSDRMDFLTKHFHDESLVIPPEDCGYGSDYDPDPDFNGEYGVQNPITLSTLIQTFSNLLESQIAALGNHAVHRLTPINYYADTLANVTRQFLGSADSVLIADIVYAITGEPITSDMIRKRLEMRLSQ